MMLGFAKKEFFSTKIDSIDESSFQDFFFSLAIENNELQFIDFIAAEYIQKKFQKKNEGIYALLIHLLFSLRLGHLSLSFQENTFFPCPKKYWLKLYAPFPQLTEKWINNLYEKMKKAFYDLTILIKKFPDCGLVIQNNCLYIHKTWYYETICLEKIKEILLQKPISIDIAMFFQQINTYNLLDMQKKASMSCLNSSFSIITGGPGTGKTYTAGCIVEAFATSFEKEHRKKPKILLSAPTGKAVSKLRESLIKLNKENTFYLESATLHSLLHIKSSPILIKKYPTYLDADLILVDESSMIDIRIMAYLLSSIPSHTRLILLGDPHQLPPVESGHFFNTLIEALYHNYSVPYVYTLKECLRIKNNQIVDCASFIIERNEEALLDKLHQDHTFIDWKNIEPFEMKEWEKEKLIDQITDQFCHLASCSNKEIEIIKRFDTFKVLSPFNQGEWGCIALNEIIKEKFCKKQNSSHTFLPIIITQNDYSMDLFNGETGIIYTRINAKTKEAIPESAFFLRKEDPFSFFSVPIYRLPSWEYSFCLSVHKSQGSEFFETILIFPQGSQRFGNQVLYTALTRTQHACKLIAKDSTLKKVILT